VACTKEIMHLGEEIFEIRSCVEILANDIKVDTTDVNRELQGIQEAGLSPRNCASAAEYIGRHWK